MRSNCDHTGPDLATRRVSTWAVVACSLAAALVASVSLPSVASATPLASKQAQAAQLDREVTALEERYGNLQEQWRGARIELRQLDGDIRTTRAELDVAREELRVAKSRLTERAIAIYRDGSGSTQLLQAVQAASLREFFDRVEAIDRVSTQDARILRRVRSAAERVQRRERQLRAQRVRQAAAVKRAERAKQRMGTVLAKRQAALSSVTAEIRSIMAQQRVAAAAADTAAARSRVATIQAGGTPEDGATIQTDGDGASSESVPLPPASGSASSAAGIAMGKVGSPYAYGAGGPSSFDCSGLVVWAFGQAGRGGLPHSSYALMGMGVEVPMAEAQVGDLVFTDGGGHMGIYVGGGSFVHAPRAGRSVTVEGLSYYSVVSVRRI